MPKRPSLEYGGPATSFSPYGAKNGAKIAKATSSRVMPRPNANRFCRSALRKVDGSAGAIGGGGGASPGARDVRDVVGHEEIAVLARGVSRMERMSATRFTTT